RSVLRLVRAAPLGAGQRSRDRRAHAGHPTLVMMFPRREFLVVGGAGLFAAACRPARLLGIDSEVSPSFPFSAPTAGEIDLASHLLNRCTFGARPGDRESLLSLGPTAWIETQLNPQRIEDKEAERILHCFPTLQEPAGELYEYKPRV